MTNCEHSNAYLKQLQFVAMRHLSQQSTASPSLIHWHLRSFISYFIFQRSNTLMKHCTTQCYLKSYKFFYLLLFLINIVLNFLRDNTELCLPNERSSTYYTSSLYNVCIHVSSRKRTHTLTHTIILLFLFHINVNSNQSVFSPVSYN